MRVLSEEEERTEQLYLNFLYLLRVLPALLLSSSNIGTTSKATSGKTSDRRVAVLGGFPTAYIYMEREREREGGRERERGEGERERGGRE